MDILESISGSLRKSRQIAVYYPCFLGNGAEEVAPWMLQALHERYDVTVKSSEKLMA